MQSLNTKEYCYLCFVIGSKERPIIRLVCNHTICIVCNTETYCALCRLSKCSVRLSKCSDNSPHCNDALLFVTGYLKRMVDDEIDKLTKRHRVDYVSPSSLPLPIINTDPLIDDIETAQLCMEHCSTDDDETSRIKDIMTRSPLPSISFDDTDFDEIFS